MASHVLLIDADLLLHRAAAASEQTIDWEDEVTSVHSTLADTKRIITSKVEQYCERLDSKWVIMVFSEGNFRKALCADYKSNRTERKPVGYSLAKTWMMETYECISVPGLEADDVLGIMTTSNKYPNSIIVSDDKDFLQVPCKLYRPATDELKVIPLAEADYTHMVQTLTGDRADNYPGCPGIGPVKAEQMLRDANDRWSVILSAFEAKGLTEEDALLQARLARILRYEDFNRKTKEPILWNPKQDTATTVGVTPPTPVEATSKRKRAVASQAPSRSSPKKSSTKPSPPSKASPATQSTSPRTTRSGKSSRSRSSSKTISPSA